MTKGHCDAGAISVAAYVLYIPRKWDIHLNSLHVLEAVVRQAYISN